MRYNSTINNIKAKEWGLTIQQAYLFSWFYELPSWANKVMIENEIFYFASKNKAVEELPILTDKTDTMYRYYKQLELLDLVVIKKIDSKDYISLTSKAKEWNFSKSEYSENNPSIVGNLSESNSENNPTYNIYNNNNNINNKEEEKTFFSDLNTLDTETNKQLKKEKKESARAILFSASDWFDYETLREHLRKDKDFVEKYKGVDLKFYISKAEMWSENNPSKKRTNRGWLLTLRDWMRSALENKELKILKDYKKPEEKGGFTNH